MPVEAGLQVGRRPEARDDEFVSDVVLPVAESHQTASFITFGEAVEMEAMLAECIDFFLCERKPATHFLAEPDNVEGGNLRFTVSESFPEVFSGVDVVGLKRILLSSFGGTVNDSLGHDFS